MRGTHGAALLSAVVAAIVIPAFPAAAAIAPLPETVLKVKSLDWQPRTGDVEVTARVKCTGDGRFRWAAALAQKDQRARSSSNVPCDGDGYLSRLILDPRGGRFHPGAAQFTLEQYIENDHVGIGAAELTFIRITAR